MNKFNSENRTTLFWFITQRVEVFFLQILAASELRNARYSATLLRKAAIMQNITQSVHPSTIRITLYSKGPNYQGGVLLISAGAIERYFEGKTPRLEVTKVVFSCMAIPRLTGHSQPRRNWPAWDSNLLITHSILRI
jgi:hypothetical protein